MKLENIIKIYNLVCEELNNCPDEDECTDLENEIYDELANLKQVLKNNMPNIEEITKENDSNLEYCELNDEINALLVKAVLKAINNGHEIFFNNYQSYDREDGTPEQYFIDEEDYDGDINDMESILEINAPEYDKEGCNDLVIHNQENDKYYYIWYNDTYENRVYVADIKNYLEEE